MYIVLYYPILLSPFKYIYYFHHSSTYTTITIQVLILLSQFKYLYYSLRLYKTGLNGVWALHRHSQCIDYVCFHDNRGERIGEAKQGDLRVILRAGYWAVVCGFGLCRVRDLSVCAVVKLSLHIAIHCATVSSLLYYYTFTTTPLLYIALYY